MPIHSVYTLSKDDAEARSWHSFFRRHGYSELSNLIIERVYWLEGNIEVEKLLPLLANPLYQQTSSRTQLKPEMGPVVEIAYRPAVTDPETPSILAGARALGEDGLEFARLSKRYQFVGLEEAGARKIAARFLYNKIVERVREPNETPTTLRPSGKPDPVTSIALALLNDEQLMALSRQHSWYAPLAQMRAIQGHERSRGRVLTDAEIEIVAQTWSDHCYHTTWKSLGLLRRLTKATERIHHPLVVSVFKDNAGGIEFYDDWVVTIKGETHNFPSSIAPFGGVATKHGGVIRDTLGFGKGAYPIGGTTIMGTMDPRMAEDAVPPGALHPQLVVTESIRATAYYTNPMGIPMMHPIYRQHPGYAKCLALGHSVGLIPKKHALKDAPQPGDVALLIGGETGRDGIHGATVSSTGMTGETLERESAAVQIGHPITERRFTSAIPVLREADCIRSITDLGAGGISCAAGEMGAETGVALNLDAVPLKDQGLTAWEILLSESQERMLLAVPPEKLDQAQEILDCYEVGHCVLGHFTDTKRLEAVWRGGKVVNLEMSFLWEACPIEPLEEVEPRRQPKLLDIPEPRSQEEWGGAFRRVLSHYHGCDQSSAGSRFDTTVQGRTAVGPYGGRNHQMPTNIAVSAPLHGKPYGVITTIAMNPFYGEIDPAQMARLMMVEAITKAVVAGADFREMALCDNFYTPKVRPGVAWDLSRMVETIADFSVAIGVPFISGKDSSSGTLDCGDRKIEVPLTLAVATLGRIPNVKKIVTKEFKRAGNKLLLVGGCDASYLAGTVYADSYGQRGARLYDPGPTKSIMRLWDALHQLHNAGKYVSGSAIAEGGVGLRLFEAAYGSGLGADIDLVRMEAGFGKILPRRELKGRGKIDDAHRAKLRSDGLVFGEFIGSVILEVPSDFKIESFPRGVSCTPLGEVITEPILKLRGAETILWQDSISALTQSWNKTFQEVVE
ncbi:MAG TPA: AIR synthase-related protein [Terriglobia bacterium]|nr:AIR synthase-related protein [Terriglobia bacterium]